MKKIAFTFLVLLIITTIGYPQNQKNDSTKMDWEWAPVGAVWMYSTVVMDFENPYYNNDFYYWYVRSEKDTVLKEKQCRKLSVNRFYEPYENPVEQPPRYTYDENGKIYFYSSDADEFQLVYDFAAQPGDTITLYSPLFAENCYVNYTVTAIIERAPGIWTESYPDFYTNFQLTEYHLNNISGNCFPFTANHPAIGHYLSFSGATYGEMCPSLETNMEREPIFNCYYDGNVEVSRLKNDVLDSCQCYYQEHLDISQNDVNSKIDAYPNPVDKILTIKLNQPKGDLIKIFNALGRLIYQNHVFTEKHTVIFTEYPAGLYIVTINNNSQLLRKKIIKTKN